MNNYNNWSTPVRYLIFGLLFLLFLIGLWYIRSVLEPLIIAAFIAYLLTPAVNFLPNAHACRVTARSTWST